MKAERQINVKLKYLRNLEKSHANLLRACKDWVQWFEYVSAYQNENLGHGLKEAEENWKSMTIFIAPFAIKSILGRRNWKSLLKETTSCRSKNMRQVNFCSLFQGTR